MSTRVDVQTIVDRAPLRPLHYAVLGVCTLAMFIDGFDVFMVGKIAPAIARGLGHAPKDMTSVFLLQQIGLGVGAFAVTPAADRFGRRLTLIVCGLCFALLTLASGLAQTLTQFGAIRCAAGFFLAGGLPIALAMIADMSPAKRRPLFITLGMVGYSAGSAVGGLTAWLVKSHGWQSAFWCAGVLSLFLPPLLLLIPESLPHLVGRGAEGRRIANLLNRLDPMARYTGEETFVIGDGSAKATKGDLLGVFRDGRLRATLITWLCLFFSMGSIALVGSWMPSFFQEMGGISIQRFATLSLMQFPGGVVGTLLAGWLMSRISPARLISVFYVLGALVLWSLGSAARDEHVLMLGLLALGFCSTGGQAALNTLLTQIYPARMRSTGLGWAGGIGRIGGMLAPVAGGVAFSAGLDLQQTLLLVATPSVVVAIAITALGAAPGTRAMAAAKAPGV